MDERRPELLAYAQQATEAAVEDILSRGRTRQAVSDLAGDAYRLLDGLLASIDRERRPACRAGCAWCCRVRVACQPPEVVAVADFVRSGLTRRARARLAARLEAVLDQTSGVDSASWARRRLPCPFLEGGREGGMCVVHPARPLACRGWHSYSVEQCKRHWRDSSSGVDASGLRLSLRGVVSRALGDSLKGVGLASEALDLASAVGLILDRPSSVDGWLRGEDAFSAARWLG